MKSERGITITSIMIYVIAFTFTVIIIGRMITFFYKNIKDVSKNTDTDGQYTKITSYITKEINIEENEVESWGKDYIIFSKSENQYTFKNGQLFMNKVKIANNLEKCEFYYDEDNEIIYVNIQIKDKYYSSTYTIAK